MRGGYQIVDFGNVPFTTATPATIEGIYQKIHDNVMTNHTKPTLISGLVITDIHYPDMFVAFYPDIYTMKATFTYGVDTVAISVEPNDEVTVTVE